MKRKSGLIIWVISGVMGLIGFIRLYPLSFMFASIDLKVNKNEAISIAENFLKERKVNLLGYSKTIFFNFDETAIYLERMCGLEEALKLLEKKVPGWYWEIRWFKPLVKEEYKVFIGPGGEIKGFIHVLDENAKGENLSSSRAFLIASKFLAKQSINLSSYNLIQSSSEKRKYRTDHTFVWEHKDFKVKDAPFQVKVSIFGKEVGEFNQYLKVPEKFLREYNRQSSHGMLIASISQFFMVLFVIISLCIVIIGFKRGNLQWRFAGIVGTVTAILVVANQINSIPIIKSFYSTDTEIVTFLSEMVITAMLGALFMGISVFLTASAGDYLVRETFKDIPPPSVIFRWKNLCSYEFAISSLRGYSLGFMWLATFLLFYMVGRKFFGVWMPPNTPYHDMLSTYLPFLVPLTIGVIASIHEEFIFRLFSISLLKRYLRSTSLAIIIPAICWAFGHSHYPVFPVYIRGIELTILGIVLGYIFIRYGILPCIIAHYIINAVFVGIPLLSSSNLTFIIYGVIVVGLLLLPLIPILITSLIKLKKKSLVEIY